MKRWILAWTSMGVVLAAVATGAIGQQQPGVVGTGAAPAADAAPGAPAASPTPTLVPAADIAPVAAPALPARRGKVKVEKAMSLGLDVSPASPSVREQLKLPRGAGLSVDAVHDNAPAKAAGVEQRDVLQKLNDQWLVNPPQFYTLLRGMKAGDEVALTLFRDGQLKTV